MSGRGYDAHAPDDTYRRSQLAVESPEHKPAPVSSFGKLLSTVGVIFLTHSMSNPLICMTFISASFGKLFVRRRSYHVTNIV